MNSEDAFYDAMHSVPLAQRFLQRELPSFMCHDIKWESLILQPPVKVDEGLSGTIRTILYRMMRFGGYATYVLLIMGDQNAVEEPIAMLVQRLMAKVMVRYQNKGSEKPFPFVYPITVHTGKRPYRGTGEDRQLDDKFLLFQVIEERLKTRDGDVTSPKVLH